MCLSNSPRKRCLIDDGSDALNYPKPCYRPSPTGVLGEDWRARRGSGVLIEAEVETQPACLNMPGLGIFPGARFLCYCF